MAWRELRELADLLADASIPDEHFDFDFTMVRGLGYYTGPDFRDRDIRSRTWAALAAAGVMTT